ncbi:MATE family efflux transporter [Veronia pacifica]|uniref:Multidrug export protein MepA n=2 Tax=Veronia pacifica TaxID=1080227 RepID=A0A1C3EL13_9GAMM|nr:MATE family efflux transporter [Veronia pacifica]ODA33910.1 MATE family efflux transporter [Veronia pacifica]
MTSAFETSDQQLVEQPVFKLFLRYSLPTIAAMLVTGIYVVVDGIFIGHFIGEDGLAAIMVAYPIGSVLYALGNLVGMGASSLVSIKLGQKLPGAAQKIVGNAFLLCLLMTFLTSVLGLFFADDLLHSLGAKEPILSMASTYLRWYFALGGFAILTMAFSTLLRNDGQPKLVTGIMILGGLLNIVLDWLLIVVIPWELTGAAIATMLSQAVTAALCLQHFFRNGTRLKITLNSMLPSAAVLRDIFQIGTPGFLMYLYLSVVLTFHNMAFLFLGSTVHVAAYAIVSYVEAFFYLVFEGIALGMQPITSFNFGAERIDRVKESRNIALASTIVIAALGMLLVYVSPELLVAAFSSHNPVLEETAVEGMQLYFWGLPLEGMLLVGAIYFQSVNQASVANWLTGGKLILIAAVLALFCLLFGATGVWISLPVTAAALTIYMFWKLKQQAGQQIIVAN